MIRLRTLRIGLLALVISLGLGGMLPGPVLAAPAGQAPVRLTYGTTVQGTITDNQSEVLYDFEGSAGDVVMVEMTARNGDLDPYLSLLNASGGLLISNDDIANDNYNSRIEYYTLPSSGVYQIAASRYNQANGTSTGSYSLTLSRVEAPAAAAAAPASLGVDYQAIEQNITISGELSGDASRYYLISGNAGDVVVALLRPQDNNLRPLVRFLTTDLQLVSPSVEQEDGGAGSYFVLPEPGDYLIEVASQSGAGAYDLETVGFAAQWLAYGDQVTGSVTEAAPNNWYVFDARFGDAVTVELDASDGDLVPYAVLADVNLNDLAATTIGDDPARLTFEIPRSGHYVILAGREGLRDGSTSGAFSLHLTASHFDPARLQAQTLGYGRTAQGTLSDAAPMVYYSFQGKRNDLVTITMQASDPAALDPFLELFDAGFNVLAESDNVSTSNTARIFQFQLPDNGVYTILAGRSGLDAGQGGGTFNLELLVGEVRLTAGAVEATLRWSNESDMDLFVQDPNGDMVAWDTGTAPSGGVLELDTNANCETVTTLPVEHVYWPQGTDLPGVYTFTVWYQLDCGGRGPSTFDLRVSAGGREVAHATDTLRLGEHYVISITLGEDGSAFSNADGAIIPAEAQSTGNAQIAYGQTVTGTIDAEAYVYYDFSGQAGDVIEVTLENASGDLDPYAGLFDSGGNVLAEDDDSAGNRNSRFTYTLPSAGTYTIVATRYEFEDGTTTGGFRLTLKKTN